MDKIKNIIFIQQRYKFIFHLQRKKLKLKNDIYYQLNKIILRNHSNFKNYLISNYCYNNNNCLLQEIINKKINYNSLNSLNKLKLEVNKYILKIGTNKISDILNFIFNKKITNLKINLETITFIDEHFVPIEGCIYDKNINNIEYNYEIIKTCSSISYSKNKKSNISLFEHVNGCIIYLKINNNILIVKGYFPEDPLNLLKKTNILYNKNNKLLEKVKYINIDNFFKYNYIEQLSIRDLFILNIDEIIENIQTDYLKIINYKQNNISYIVKDFLNKNIKEQLEIIVLFLLNKNNEELLYIAYMLYDLINNDSYLLKSQPLSNQIYNNLHWSLQKDFKQNFNKLETKIKNKMINIDEISYEKRIYLMNCSDTIKQKAYEKNKEISNKSNDNTYKSEQYLVSLLKIPFGVYKKEEIINSKEKFKIYIKILVKSINDYIESNNINFKINNYDTDLYINIQRTIIKIKEFNDIFISNDDIKKIINFYIKNNKNKNIQDLIEILNEENIEYKIKNKGTKTQYIQNLTQFFNDSNINNQIKIKYLDKIQKKNKDNKILYKKIKDNIEEWDNYIVKKKQYIENIDIVLDNAIFSQTDAKLEIKRIIGQWINGKMNGYCLGFEGPPGIGKTSLAKKGISKCLIDEKNNCRPFAFIALGGSSNGSILEGHNYTYVGSNYGKIVDILIQTKCMNPIIYIDELDKISNTENGKELIGILTHLTDTTQNEHFNDKYFSGIDFDLSKVLFIFSYNDYSKIDPILLDRIHRVKFNYLKVNEKIHIVQYFIVPEILDLVGLDNQYISFTDDSIKYIINNYTYEAGIRKLKEKIGEIIRQINLDLITNKNMKQKIEINTNYIKHFFMNRSKINHKHILNKNYVGLVNGLFATSMGIGGITVIQATKTYSDN